MLSTPPSDEACIDALKYFSLENYISEPSNEDGVCVFNNLTIAGSITKSAYISIVVEGVSKTWTLGYIPDDL